MQSEVRWDYHVMSEWATKWLSTLWYLIYAMQCPFKGRLIITGKGPFTETNWESKIIFFMFADTTKLSSWNWQFALLMSHSQWLSVNECLEQQE